MQYYQAFENLNAASQYSDLAPPGAQNLRNQMTKSKIFLIEDDPDITTLVTDTLKKEGYEISAFDKGVEAVSQVESVSPDLINIDQNLTDMEDLEISKDLKK